MRRFIVLVLASLVLLTLSACKGGPDKAKPSVAAVAGAAQAASPTPVSVIPTSTATGAAQAGAAVQATADQAKQAKYATRTAIFNRQRATLTQAAAADLLRDATVKVYDAGLDARLTVHDEIVVDGYHDELLGEIMLDVAPWAQAMPLSGEGGHGERYGK